METPLLVNFNLTQQFFGLNEQHSLNLQNQIFDMIWYSDGRFDWNTLYTMPTVIRRLYFKKIKAQIESRKTT